MTFNISYGDLPRQTLDIYTPEDVDSAPVVIYIHGGVWSVGDKDHYQNIGHALAENGYVGVLINYRLSPQVRHPRHTQDVARAFAWVKEHITDYGGDPERVYLMGHSAGGHMALLLALDPYYLEAVNHTAEDIAGIISLSGVYVIDDWITQWARDVFPDDEAARAEASPYALAQQLDSADNLPPILLITSEDDYPQLIDQQADLEAVLQGLEADVESAIIPERGHFTLVNRIGEPDDPTLEQIVTWLMRF